VTYETRESDVPFSGTAVRYSGSQLEYRANYKEGKRHGLQEGYDSGELTYRANYKDGTLHGLLEDYHRGSGVLTKRENYKNGKKEGHLEYYDDDGRPTYSVYIKDGKKTDLRRNTVLEGKS